MKYFWSDHFCTKYKTSTDMVIMGAVVNQVVLIYYQQCLLKETGKRERERERYLRKVRDNWGQPSYLPVLGTLQTVGQRPGESGGGQIK